MCSAVNKYQEQLEPLLVTVAIVAVSMAPIQLCTMDRGVNLLNTSPCSVYVCTLETERIKAFTAFMQHSSVAPLPFYTFARCTEWCSNRECHTVWPDFVHIISTSRLLYPYFTDVAYLFVLFPLSYPNFVPATDKLWYERRNDIKHRGRNVQGKHRIGVRRRDFSTRTVYVGEYHRRHVQQ